MPCSKHLEYNADHSLIIDRLILKAKQMGYIVKGHCFELPVMGRIYYKKRLIKINTPCAACASIAIAHELGHAIDRFNNGRHKYKEHRERMADYYGYKIYKTCGQPVNYRNYKI